MNIEIPKFLIEMSEQINTQGNHMTADPIWQVCYDEKVLTEEGYEDGVRIMAFNDGEPSMLYDSESCDDMSHFIEDALENYPEIVDKTVNFFKEELFDPEYNFKCFCFDDFEESEFNDPERYFLFRYKKVRTVVKSCLTEKDAEWFINRKQHDYAPLYMYVYSMVFCPQMIELREWIMSLTKRPEGV